MRPKRRQQLLSEDDAQNFLRVSRTTLWRLRRTGALPFYRIGAKVRYSEEDLQSWLAAQRESLEVREPVAEYDVAGPAEGHERLWQEALESQDWSFHDSATDSLTHGIHPYPAKFPPQIPARLIEILTRPGDVVLDPFCGSGTTIVEALRLDREALGVDVNPIAVLLTQAKVARLDKEAARSLEDLELAIEADIARERGEPFLFFDRWPGCVPLPAPPIPNLDHWFSPAAVREIGLLLARIAKVENQVAILVARAVLSSILVTLSNQDSETRYTARPSDLQPGDGLSQFARKLRDVSRRLLAFRESTSPREARLYLSDARHLPAEAIGPVDAVITSPPYANAFDYHLYHRHRLYWLGWDPAVLRDLEIGSHLNYQRRGDGIATYRNDMRLSLRSIATVLKPGGPCAMVVGDSVFQGRVVENARVIADVAKSEGFDCLAAVERRIHPIKRSMIKPARRARVEKIILLVRR